MGKMRVKGKELWSAAKGELQLQFPRATYETWIKDSRAESYEDGLLVVLVRNTYAKDWLQHRLRGVIERTLAGIAHRSVEVQFVVDQAMEEEDDGVELLSGLPDLESRNHFNGSTGLNRSLTFDNFIVGRVGTGKPVFRWQATDTTGIAGYSYVLDQEPATIPPEKNMGSKVAMTFSDLKKGLWFLHLRAADGAGNWGPTTHYGIMHAGN